MRAFDGRDAVRAFLSKFDEWLSESVDVYLLGGSAMTARGLKDQTEDIDRTILLHCWTQTKECPECGCSSELVFVPETTTDDRYVEVTDCEVCDAIVQAVVDDLDPSELP